MEVLPGGRDILGEQERSSLPRAGPLTQLPRAQKEPVVPSPNGSGHGVGVEREDKDIKSSRQLQQHSPAVSMLRLPQPSQASHPPPTHLLMRDGAERTGRASGSP